MILPRPLIFLLLILSTLLLTSAFLCPEIPKEEVDTGLEQYIVFLESPPQSLIGSVLNLVENLVDNLVDHLLLLVNCLGYNIEKLEPGVGLFGDGLINQKVITDVSPSGTGFSCYIGFFNPNFVDTILKKRDEVKLVEKVVPVKADSAIPIYNLNLEKRATQTSAPYVSIRAY